MLSHTFIGINDTERASAFYAPIMVALGWQRRSSATLPDLAIWKPAETSRPLFVLGPPYDDGTAETGNGQMVALLSPDRHTVDSVHAVALSGGATCKGEPGLRPHYHADYYGAYFRDPDGNKLCIVCHDAAGRT